MSRSHRRVPIHGVTLASSEKKDKQIANRELRRKVRMLLDNYIEDMPHFREFSDPWKWPKDGRSWFGEWKNKDEQWYKKLMRK